MTEPVLRPAARIVVLAEGCTLLQRFINPEGPWEGWITPGGGIEPGETPLEAAIRELVEEVGVADATLTGPVWERDNSFPWRGALLHQHELFFVARLDQCVEVAGTLGVEALTEEGIQEQRWWPLDEVDTIVTSPVDLGERIRALG